MPSKADILASLRADIAALESRPAADGPRRECDALSAGAHEAPLPDASHPEAAAERECRTLAVEAPVCPGEEGKTAEDAYQKILRWVAVRERSTAYLRERLLRDDFALPSVEEALRRAIRVHAVDDRRYADALVRMKLAAGRGLRDAEREIVGLGIDPASLDSWAEHEQKGREFEIERALAALRRRPPRAKRVREAAYRRLVTQGFSNDVAASASRMFSEELYRDADSPSGDSV